MIRRLRRAWQDAGLASAARCGADALEREEKNWLIYDAPSKDVTVVIARGLRRRYAMRAIFEAEARATAGPPE